jgi:ribokinase
MPKTARICVVGSSNIDLTFRAARLPRSGETLAGSAFRLGFGGKGANQAVAAARLGAQVSMVSRVGRDVFGEQTLGNFRAHGIDTTHVNIDDQRPTGAASITVDDAAHNCILVVPGANLGLLPADIHKAADAIGGVDVLLCQLEVPVETTLEAFRMARAAGVRTVLNPAPAAPLPEELLHLTDLCVPNETEVDVLTGQTARTPTEAQRAARALLDRGPGLVIVTLGEQGALAADRQTVEHFPAMPVAAVDTSGAGDAFIGGLAVFLAEDLPLREAVRRANAVAALSVTCLGTQAAVPTRGELEAFLRGKN